MNTASKPTIEPRKKPVQARSTITVEAIMEATIQVLLSHGVERLTTTRVSERAGVSVGTLYQYYPNKQSLLFALLEQHMEQIASAVETACDYSHDKPLAEMVQYVVERFVDAKMQRTDISMALYRISTEVGGPELVKRATGRLQKALGTMLNTASDVNDKPEPFAIEMMMATMSGTTRSVLEAGTASPLRIQKLREHLVLLCQSYMKSLSTTPSFI